MTHHVVLIAGDGIGPEVSEATRQILAAAGADVRWVERFAGIAALDRFDRVQLEDVLGVCLASRSLSEAGRTLFAVSRTKRSTPNDADRLRKYLSRYGLSWRRLTGTPKRS